MPPQCIWQVLVMVKKKMQFGLITERKMLHLLEK